MDWTNPHATWLRSAAAEAEQAATPLRAVAVVRAARAAADEFEAEAVRHAKAEGATWQQIADALGVSRQVAHRKHADRLARRKGRDEADRQ